LGGVAEGFCAAVELSEAEREELVAAIADPEAALKARGIPVVDGAVLPLVFNVTSPPEMARLQDLAGQLSRKVHASDADRLGACYARPESACALPRGALRQQPTVVETLGALAFGLGLSRAVLRHTRWR
jgi:hypothetical protein